jgi:hypothetical protein
MMAQFGFSSTSKIDDRAKSFRCCVRKLIKRPLPLACSKSNPLEPVSDLNADELCEFADCSIGDVVCAISSAWGFGFFVR